MEMERLNFKTEIRLSQSGKKIRGFLPYNSTSHDMGFKEKILPGAFSRSIKSGKKIMSFWSHREDKPLANTESGTLILKDTASGLDITILPDLAISWHNDAIRSVRRGDTDGFSFGFRTPKGGDRWDQDGNRELIDVDLIELSPVVFAAYGESQATVRNKGKNKMNIKELRQERYGLFESMKALNDKGALSADEQRKYNEMDSDFDRLTDQIEKLETEEQARLSRAVQMEEKENLFRTKVDKPHKTPPGGYYEHEHMRSKVRLPKPVNPEQRKLWESYLVRGMGALNAEQRALQSDSDTQGGYLISPEYFLAEIIRGIDDETYALDICRIIDMDNAQSLGIPELDADPADADWTAEIATGSEDSSMRFTKRSLTPHPLAKRLKVSETLIRRSPIAGPLVQERLSYKFGITVEKAFLIGSGQNQALGCMIANDSGITTARDVSTGNTTSAIKSDNLIEVAFSLKAGYLRRAKWIFHRDGVKQLRRLKDGEGQYLFQTSITEGTPNRLLGMPLLMSEYQKNTFSASQYVGILGDFNYYYWARALKMTIKVLDQLYAETNQIGYIGRMELDGMPVVEEAFARVKLAA